MAFKFFVFGKAAGEGRVLTTVLEMFWFGTTQVESPVASASEEVGEGLITPGAIQGNKRFGTIVLVIVVPLVVTEVDNKEAVTVRYPAGCLLCSADIAKEPEMYHCTVLDRKYSNWNILKIGKLNQIDIWTG